MSAPIDPQFTPYKAPQSSRKPKHKPLARDVLTNNQNIQPSQQKLTPGRFKEWRDDKPADMRYTPIVVDERSLQGLDSAKKRLVIAKCLGEYEKANKSLEQAIGDTTLRYIYPNGDPEKSETKSVRAPLLELSQTMSERYLDLMRAYVAFEKKKGLPMISNAAGQMKNHGFETEEIVRMQKSCLELMDILHSLKEAAKPDMKKYEAAKDLLFSKEKRAAFSTSTEFDNLPALKAALTQAITQYQALPESTLIDRAFFMMWNFPQMSHEEIEMQLYEVANLQALTYAAEDERLLMEIRHRIGGEGSVQQSNPGSVGQNPLAYLNIIKKGEPDNPEGQFRKQMYFVYMCNNFANTVMQNPELIDFANAMLNREGKDWQIDKTFVHDMNSRGAKYLPPVFRYGTQAALNSFVRTKSSDKEKVEFEKKLKIPTLQELVEYNETYRSKKISSKTAQVSKRSILSHDSSFRHTLTKRELLNQFGEYHTAAIHTDQPLKFHAGGAGFHLRSSKELQQKKPTAPDPKYEAAKAYVKLIENLKIPVAAGISGTLDQTMTMAGLIGIGLDENREKDQEKIKLALLAFMIPNTDHSVHEVLQSTKTFGLEYVPGPGFEKYIYPSGGSQFLEYLRQEQEKRGLHMPSYYLSRRVCTKSS